MDTQKYFTLLRLRLRHTLYMSKSPTSGSPLVKPNGVTKEAFDYTNKMLVDLNDKLARLRIFARMYPDRNPAEVEGYMDIYIHRDRGSNVSSLKTNIEYLAKLISDTKRKLKKDPETYIYINRARPLDYFCMDGKMEALAQAIYIDDESNIGWDKTRSVEANIADMIGRYSANLCNDIQALWEKGTIEDLKRAEGVYEKLTAKAIRAHINGLPAIQAAIGEMYRTAINQTLDKIVPVFDVEKELRKQKKQEARERAKKQGKQPSVSSDEEDIMNMTQTGFPSLLSCPEGVPSLEDIQKQKWKLIDQEAAERIRELRDMQKLTWSSSSSSSGHKYEYVTDSSFDSYISQPSSSVSKGSKSSKGAKGSKNQSK